MGVTRCVCRNVSFVDALEIARSNGCASVRDLQSLLDLGSGCGLCVPYMQRVLITGLTDQPVLSDAEMDRLRLLSGVQPKEARA
jgi:bacterioferritin-associated ferredoxin